MYIPEPPAACWAVIRWSDLRLGLGGQAACKGFAVSRRATLSYATCTCLRALTTRRCFIYTIHTSTFASISNSHSKSISPGLKAWGPFNDHGTSQRTLCCPPLARLLVLDREPRSFLIMRPSLVTPRWPGGSNAHRFCQLSQLRPVAVASSQPAAKCPFATLGPGPVATRHLPRTSERGLFLKPTIPSVRSYRFGPPKTSKSPLPAKAETGKKQANRSAPSNPNTSPAVETGSSHPASEPIPDSGTPWGANEEAALLRLDQTKDLLLAGHSIPDEKEVLSALDACKTFASLHNGKLVRYGLKKEAKPDDSSASSSLLSLDGTTTSRAGQTRPISLNDYISRLAFEIVSHPSVVITPQILDAYVGIQGLLGDPDPLPYVLELYASKPKPRGSAGSLEYVQRNPNTAINAVDPKIAERALDVAIEAKNMDAAVGIVANTYGSIAFLRQKLLRKALLPVTAVAATPPAVYLVASRLATFQQLYDDRTATAMAAAGLFVYIGSTAFMGFLALFTHNDQMNRVTWAPGMRLFSRWLREEERAGLDKIATAFGFSEVNRHGEEEGTDFESLRKFILLRGMVLDRVESMPGMK